MKRKKKELHTTHFTCNSCVKISIPWRRVFPVQFYSETFEQIQQNKTITVKSLTIVNKRVNTLKGTSHALQVSTSYC